MQYTVGIITAVKSELESILKITKIEKKETRHQIDFYIGRIANKKVLVALCGIGKIQASKCTMLMIEHFHFDNTCFIINTGSAGALNPNLELGDIVIANRCVQFDLDLSIFEDTNGTFYQRGQFRSLTSRYIMADASLVQLCTKIASAESQNTKTPFKSIIGTIATGDQFINDPAWKLQAHIDFEADCDEMEGAAVGLVCMDANIPFIVIRSISDKPKDKKTLQYTQFKFLAANRCSEFIYQMLTHPELGF